MLPMGNMEMVIFFTTFIPMGVNRVMHFSWKNVLYTHSYVFYTLGCNVFIHARTNCTLAHTTSLPVVAMYLHARTFWALAHVFHNHGCNVLIHASTFCTLAHTTSIPVGAIYFFNKKRFFLHKNKKIKIWKSSWFFYYWLYKLYTGQKWSA